MRATSRRTRVRSAAGSATPSSTREVERHQLPRRRRARHTRAPGRTRRTDRWSSWPRLTSHGEDVERLLDRHRLLVRAIARGERVVDVADRHHARGHRDLVAAQAVRDSRCRRASRGARPRSRGRRAACGSTGSATRKLYVCTTWLLISSALLLGQRAAPDLQAARLVARQERQRASRPRRGRSCPRSRRSARSRPARARSARSRGG